MIAVPLVVNMWTSMSLDHEHGVGLLSTHQRWNLWSDALVGVSLSGVSAQGFPGKPSHFKQFCGQI